MANQDLQKSLYFPTDLVHCVVDHLTGDREALTNCALVARDFVHPTRKQIFSQITLKQSSAHPQPATRLLDFLSEAPHLIPYIASLRVVVDISPPSEHDAPQTSWAHEDPALPLVLADLQHLKEISVESSANLLQWVGLPLHLQDILCSVFTRPILSDLSLIQVANFPIKTLRMCANLKRLVLRCVTLLVDEKDTTIYPDLGASLCLENLEMIESRDTFFNVNTWLQNPDIVGMDTSSLKQLTLALYGRSNRYTEDMHAITRFLERSSPSLEVLKLTPPIMCAEISDITGNPFHLHAIPNLHKLEFNIEISDFDDVETSPALVWLAELFAHIPPSNVIQDVVLKCEVLQANPLGDFDSRIWVEIDKFLACKELARLRRVALIIYPIYSAGKTHAPLDTEVLQKEMSILHKRNILQVEKRILASKI